MPNMFHEVISYGHLMNVDLIQFYAALHKFHLLTLPFKKCKEVCCGKYYSQVHNFFLKHNKKIQNVFHKLICSILV